MLWCFFSVCTSSAEGRTFFSAASVGLSFLSPSSSPLRLSLMSISLGMSLIVRVSMARCVRVSPVCWRLIVSAAPRTSSAPLGGFPGAGCAPPPPALPPPCASRHLKINTHLKNILSATAAVGPLYQTVACCDLLQTLLRDSVERGGYFQPQLPSHYRHHRGIVH